MTPSTLEPEAEPEPRPGQRAGEGDALNDSDATAFTLENDNASFCTL